MNVNKNVMNSQHIPLVHHAWILGGHPKLEDAGPGDLSMGGKGHCSFEVVSVSPEAVTIRDLDIGKSVTNDAEHAVQQLLAADLLVPGRKLFYYDSDGELDEIVWEGFEIWFRAGPRSEKS